MTGVLNSTKEGKHEAHKDPKDLSPIDVSLFSYHKHEWTNVIGVCVEKTLSSRCRMLVEGSVQGPATERERERRGGGWHVVGEVFEFVGLT